MTAAAAPSPAGAPAGASTRVGSLDFVRGVVMILMAIDHVRVYSGVPAGGPTPGVFFTRWITHFVAPAFVFLAGTAAYLHGRRVGRAALARFLVTRGAWLVLLELTVIRVSWAFNVDFAHYLLAGVIWMIGWCMILLALLVYLPTRVIGGFGVATILGHNLLNYLPAETWKSLGEGPLGWLWSLVYGGGAVELGPGGPPLIILYVLVPWIGVMAAGYAFGLVVQMEPERRRTLCIRLGVALTVAFVALRALNGYGDRNHWSAGAPLSFLATSKYPASLLFLLMTLGPMLVLLGVAERARGRIAGAVTVFGRVPFFYYLLHIPLIHLLACVVSLLRTGAVDPWLFANHPMLPPEVPDGYMWSLPLLYLVWLVAIAILYVACRWYAALKARRRDWWLGYL